MDMPNNTSTSFPSSKISTLALTLVSRCQQTYARRTSPRRAPFPNSAPVPHRAVPHRWSRRAPSPASGRLWTTTTEQQRRWRSSSGPHRRARVGARESVGGATSRRPTAKVYTRPTSPHQVGRGNAATSCFRRSRLMFQVFDLDVVKVYLRCCICCNDNIHMLSVYFQIF